MNDTKIQPKTLAGFMELMPSEQVYFEQLKNIIEKNFVKNGFLPLDTPVLESSEVLLAKAGGETEKQIYSFTKGDTNMCMRFDLTVPLAKFVSANLNQLTFPFKRYQIGKVYRGERPQKGRLREFYQCDIDIVGKESLSIKYDAEIPSIIYNIFKEINIGDFVISISNRKLLNGLVEFLKIENKDDIGRIIDKYYKIGEQNVILTLKDLNLTQKQIDGIINFIKIDGTNDEIIQKLKNLNINNQLFDDGINELVEVAKFAKVLGVEENNFKINLTIVRGLDYYTGTVYETFIKGHENMGSICSGGRYDNLASFYTDTKLPGVGISIGLSRLFVQLKENNLLSNFDKTTTKALIIPMGEQYENCFDIAKKLRQNNINCEVYLEDVKFKNKLSYANKLNVPYVIIVGEDEIKNDKYSLKNMYVGEQTQNTIEEIIEKLK